ncbi:type II toxin-antitoxin system ParD family antitoxin [Rhodoglobus sp. NPDC076762]
MAHNTSISLDDHFADFLSREVETGRYRSVSEVVCEGCRRYGIGSPDFCTVGANSVAVIRILHEWMDLTRHF